MNILNQFRLTETSFNSNQLKNRFLMNYLGSNKGSTANKNPYSRYQGTTSPSQQRNERYDQGVKYLRSNNSSRGQNKNESPNHNNPKNPLNKSHQSQKSQQSNTNNPKDVYYQKKTSDMQMIINYNNRKNQVQIQNSLKRTEVHQKTSQQYGPNQPKQNEVAGQGKNSIERDTFSNQKYNHRTYQRATWKNTKSETNLHKAGQSKTNQNHQGQKSVGHSSVNQVKNAYYRSTLLKQSKQNISKIKSQQNLLQPRIQQKNLKISAIDDVKLSQPIQAPYINFQAKSQMQKMNDIKLKQVFEYANRVNNKNKDIMSSYYKIQNQRNSIKHELKNKEQELTLIKEKWKFEKNRANQLAQSIKNYRHNEQFEEIKKKHEQSMRNILKKCDEINIQLRGKTEELYQTKKQLSQAQQQRNSLLKEEAEVKFEIQRIKNQIKYKESSITKKDQQLNELRQKNQKLLTRNKELEGRISKIRIQMDERLDELTQKNSTQMQKSLKKSIKEASTLKGDLKVKEELIKNMQDKIRQITQQKIAKQREFRQTIHKLQNQTNLKVKSYQKKLLEKQRQAEKSRMSSITHIAQSQVKPSSVNFARGRESAIEDLIRIHSKQINDMNQQISAKGQQVYHLRSQIIDLKSQINNLQNQNTGLKARLNANLNSYGQKSQIQMMRLITDVQNLKKRIQAKELILETKQKQIDQKDRFIQNSLMGALKRQDLPELVKRFQQISRH